MFGSLLPAVNHSEGTGYFQILLKTAESGKMSFCVDTNLIGQP